MLRVVCGCSRNARGSSLAGQPNELHKKAKASVSDKKASEKVAWVALPKKSAPLTSSSNDLASNGRKVDDQQYNQTKQKQRYPARAVKCIDVPI